MMKISSLFWTVFTVMCCSLNQVGESKNNCGEDEYYETAIEQCRSCSIPCSVSKALCREMCPGFQAKTTVQSITEVDEGKNNCGEDEYYDSAIEQCKSCRAPCLLSEANCREMCPDYQKLTTMKPTEGFKISDEDIRILSFVGTLVVMIGVVITATVTIMKRNKKPKKEENGQGNDASGVADGGNNDTDHSSTANNQGANAPLTGGNNDNDNTPTASGRLRRFMRRICGQPCFGSR